MADDTYTIVLKNETEQANTPIAGSNSTAQALKPQTTQTPTTGDMSSGGNGEALFKQVIAVKGILAPVVDTVVSHQVSTVTLRTGAVEQQDRLSFAYSIGKQATSITMSTALGAATGNLPGALIGLALGITNTALSYKNRADEIQLQNNVENVGLRLADIRAGGSVATFSGSRLRRQ